MFVASASSRAMSSMYVLTCSSASRTPPTVSERSHSFVVSMMSRMRWRASRTASRSTTPFSSGVRIFARSRRASASCFAYSARCLSMSRCFSAASSAVIWSPTASASRPIVRWKARSAASSDSLIFAICRSRAAVCLSSAAVRVFTPPVAAFVTGTDWPVARSHWSNVCTVPPVATSRACICAANGMTFMFVSPATSPATKLMMSARTALICGPYVMTASVMPASTCRSAGRTDAVSVAESPCHAMSQRFSSRFADSNTLTSLTT